MDKKLNNKLRTVIITALFAAMIFALTFSIKLPTPGGGYIHLGDAMIYLSACILPTPFALLAAAVGGAMSDFAGGYAVYIIPTLIIKALNALPFDAKSNKIVTVRNALCSVFSGIITVGGYYIAAVAMLALSASGSIASFGEKIFSVANWTAAAASSIPSNCVQAAGSAVLFLIIGFALDKAKVKEKLARLIK